MGKGTNYVKKPTTLDALTLAGRLNAHTVKIIQDDWHAPGATEDELLSVWRRADERLRSLGLRLHPTKTRIRSAKDGVVFLGFLFRVTDKGKVLMLRDPKRVKEVKRRLRRLAHKIGRGEVRADALDESYRCVRACMEKGNSAKLLRNMDAFFNQVKGEIAA